MKITKDQVKKALIKLNRSYSEKEITRITNGINSTFSGMIIFTTDSDMYMDGLCALVEAFISTPASPPTKPKKTSKVVEYKDPQGVKIEACNLGDFLSKLLKG